MVLRRIKVWGQLVCFCAASACATTTASASVIYDNYTDPTVPSGTGIAFPASYDGAPVWDSFTPRDTEQLATLSMVLVGVPEGDPTETLQVGLFQDNNTSPGTLITNIVSVTADHLSGMLISDDPDNIGYRAYSFSLDTHPIVDAGTRYWIGILNDSAGFWCWVARSPFWVGVAGEYFANPAVHSNLGDPYEMRLTGDSVTLTPEPGSAGLLILTSTLLLLADIRREQSFLKRVTAR
jgi:hypothetical protein